MDYTKICKEERIVFLKRKSKGLENQNVCQESLRNGMS